MAGLVSHVVQKHFVGWQELHSQVTRTKQTNNTTVVSNVEVRSLLVLSYVHF